LRWAYYVTMFTVFVYLLVGLRRKQRVIPVIEPLRNTTAAFVKSTGHLQLRNKDHVTLVKNQIRYFHAFVREKYRINGILHSDDNLNLLAGKSGVPVDLIRKLLQTAEKLSLYVEIGERDARYFHERLSEFLKLCRK
jgi:hypothetical protein